MKAKIEAADAARGHLGHTTSLMHIVTFEERKTVCLPLWSPCCRLADLFRARYICTGIYYVLLPDSEDTQVLLLLETPALGALFPTEWHLHVTMFLTDLS